MKGRSLALAFALSVATGVEAVAEEESGAKALEERRFFRPVRLGLCAGYDPSCLLAGAKLEFSGKYVGVNAHFGLLWGGFSGKVYPVVAFHSDAASVRPYLGYGVAAGMMLPMLSGPSLGADVHVFKNKRLLLQPQISWTTVQRVCEEVEVEGPPPPSTPGTCGEEGRVSQSVSGSLGLMIAF